MKLMGCGVFAAATTTVRLGTFVLNACFYKPALLARGRYDDVAENLQMISELIDRTGRIVRQLKSFARQEAATPQPVSVASAIDHARMMLEPRRLAARSAARYMAALPEHVARPLAHRDGHRELQQHLGDPSLIGHWGAWVELVHDEQPVCGPTRREHRHTAGQSE